MILLPPRLFAKSRQERRVPAGSLVYGVGDIHGRRDLLAELHEAIESDAAETAAPRKVVVYVGDYVDRGPESRGVVDLLLDEPLAGFEAVHLIGNHEAFLLDFLDDPSTLALWFLNGGDETLRSYGVEVWASIGAAERGAHLRDSFAERLPARHLAFYRSLKPFHEEGDYFFAHAGIRPGVALEEQDPRDLMWIRNDFLASRQDHGKVIVHGHTPTHAPQLRANRIGIDTGAVYGGKLTAVALHDGERRLIQV